MKMRTRKKIHLHHINQDNRKLIKKLKLKSPKSTRKKQLKRLRPPRQRHLKSQLMRSSQRQQKPPFLLELQFKRRLSRSRRMLKNWTPQQNLRRSRQRNLMRRPIKLNKRQSKLTKLPRLLRQPKKLLKKKPKLERKLIKKLPRLRLRNLNLRRLKLEPRPRLKPRLNRREKLKKLKKH